MNSEEASLQFVYQAAEEDCSTLLLPYLPVADEDGAAFEVLSVAENKSETIDFAILDFALEYYNHIVAGTIIFFHQCDTRNDEGVRMK